MAPQPTMVVQGVEHHHKDDGQTLLPSTAGTAINPQPAIAPTTKKTKARTTLLPPAMEALEHAMAESGPPAKKKQTTAQPPATTRTTTANIAPDSKLAPPTKKKTKPATPVQPPATAAIEPEVMTTELGPRNDKVPNMSLLPPGTTTTGLEPAPTAPLEPCRIGKEATTKPQKGSRKRVAFVDADRPAVPAPTHRLRSAK